MEPTIVTHVEVHALDLALREPFGISTGAQVRAKNVVVQLRLASGAVGWGEAAPFEAVNGETQQSVLTELNALVPRIVGMDVRAWRATAEWLAAEGSESPSARCAIETAVLDALGNHFRVPLWVLFGGARGVLESDMTITTGGVEAARNTAARLAREGFRTIKLKIGGASLDHDLARALAVVSSAPRCALVLDANGALRSVSDARVLIDGIRRARGHLALFEQPFAPIDLEAAAELCATCDVDVAADESVASVADVIRVAHARAATVVNLKCMKSGVLAALEMASVARSHGLGLMIGGMVESELAMALSSALAAGRGDVKFVDLDTPAWLVDSPAIGGPERRGPEIDLRGVASGHGVSVRVPRG